VVLSAQLALLTLAHALHKECSPVILITACHAILLVALYCIAIYQTVQYSTVQVQYCPRSLQSPALWT